MAKKEVKKEFDGRIWPTLLEFNVNIDAQLTSKANLLFGASTLLLIFILNKAFSPDFSFFMSDARNALLVLLVGCSFSSLLSLMVILPKLRIFSKKERVPEDVFYYKNISKFYTRQSYFDYLKDLPFDNARISQAYTNQIYSLATHIIPYKFRMLKIAGWLLITSIMLSLIIFIF